MHRRKVRSFWWVAVLQVVLLLSTFVTPVSASTAPSSMTGIQLIELLRTYDIVRGDPSGNLLLDKPITRAEMITIMVRALGKEKEAEAYKGWGIFTDARGHWAEANINYAALQGLVKGDGNGEVRPNADISYAESLTLLLRMLDKEPTTGDWPINVLMAAAQLDLVPTGVTAGNVRNAAIRGPIFQTFAKGIITVPTSTGKTVLAEYVDKTPPVITVANITSPTTQASVTVSGSTDDAVSVTVNGQAATLSGRNFSATVNLSYGTNNIVVEATDIAGNKATRNVTVVRNALVSRVEASGPSKIVIGEQAEIKAIAYDANGAVVTDVPITAVVNGNIGTYNNSTGVFTASNTATSGSIVFTAGTVTVTHSITVAGPSNRAAGLFIMTPSAPLNPSQNATIEVRVVDSNGQLVTEDNGRSIGLNAMGLAGITVSPSQAKTVDGVAKFTFSATTGGVASLTAVTGSLPSASGQVTVATSTRIVLTASPNVILANGTGATTIRADLVNASGQPVANTTGQDIIIQLTRSGVGDGTMSQNVLTIGTGQSTSTGTATYLAGFTSGSLFIQGHVVSGSAFTVLGTEVTLTTSGGGGSQPLPGSGHGAPARLEFLGTIGPESPNNTVEIVVRVIDSQQRTVTTGSYPFRLNIWTSNNDQLDANGVPMGVTVRLGNTTRIPTNAGTGVIGVTKDGVARIRVSYNKNGKVFLQPVALPATTAGFDDQGNGVAQSQSSVGLTTGTHEVSFSTGSNSWTALGLTAGYTNNSTGLTFSKATTAPVPLNSSITLTATLLNAGGIVPNGAAPSVGLYRVEADNSHTLITSKAVTNGTTEFVVVAPNTVTAVNYIVKAQKDATTVVSSPVSIQTQNVPVSVAPAVVGVRGIDSAGTAREEFKVGLSDTHLQFLVQPNATGFGVIKIYRSSGSPIYTSEVRDLNGLHLINVPRNLLTNQEFYRVAVDNGAGNSPMYTTPMRVTVNAEISAAVNSALFDADTNRLTVYTNQGSTTAWIYPNRLIITAPNGTTFIPSGSRVQGSNSFVIDLSGDPNLRVLKDADVFSGVVRLTAIAGWYERADGPISAAFTTGVNVGPFASIRNAYLDMTPNNRRLILDTVGVVGGNWDLTKISIGNVLTLANSGYQLTADPSVPGRFVIRFPNTLDETTIADLQAYNGMVTANTGWYYSGSNPRNNVTSDTAQIYALLTMSNASYNSTTGVLRVTGYGFSSTIESKINLGQISIVNESTGTPTTINLVEAGNSKTIVDNNTLLITLTGANKTAMDGLTGSLIFLRTSSTWATDNGDRVAPQITGYAAPVGFSSN